MALQDKLAAAAAPRLQPGENIVTAFPAQTKSPGWYAAFGVLGLVLSGTKFRKVVVTDRRVVVFASGFWKATDLKDVVAEGSRVNLGEPKGLWWRCDALPESLVVHRRFHKLLEAANAALG